MDLIREEQFEYTDDFPTKLTEFIAKSVSTAKGTFSLEFLLEKANQLQTSFFKLNRTNREDFLIQVYGAVRDYIEIEHTKREDQLEEWTAQEVTVDDIDSFSRVDSISSSEVPDIADMKETNVKHGLARILGEPYVPIDSGVEKCDLFTSRVIFQGVRCPAAFLLKGRSFKGPLRIKHLGKPANQILRLLTEPARLYFVQHVNEITTDVRDHLKVRVSDKARKEKTTLYYCLMDGIDTARVLMAHGEI